MKPIIAVILLAMSVVACGLLPQPTEEPVVPLLTGIDPKLVGNDGGIGCWTNSAGGPVVVDLKYGTAIIDKDNDRTNTVPMPIMWRPGFVGRRVGSEVAVYDPRGNLVAITGRSYRIEGAASAPTDASEASWEACGFVTPLR